MKKIHKRTPLCREVVSYVQTQLDAGLQSLVCREIKRHLHRCPNCTAYLDSLKKTVLLFKRYPDPRFPAIMREKLFAVLKIES